MTHNAAPGTPVTVGMLWHARNSGNLGVGALTLRDIALARRAAEAAGVTPRFIIGRADKVFARDPKSLAALAELAPQVSAALSADVAFALPYEKRDHGPGIHVGINVSGLLFDGGYSGANEFGLEIDYADFTRQLIAALLQRPGVKVHLVPHVLSDSLPQDDDYRIAEALKQEFPAVLLAEPFARPVEAKSYIAGLDMLVGGRVHARIAAHSSGVAVVPVAHSRKFAGLFEGLLDCPHLVPVTGMDTAGAVAFVLDALERRGELARDCLASRAKAETLLTGDVEAPTDLLARVRR